MCVCKYPCPCVGAGREAVDESTNHGPGVLPPPPTHTPTARLEWYRCRRGLPGAGRETDSGPSRSYSRSRITQSPRVCHWGPARDSRPPRTPESPRRQTVPSGPVVTGGPPRHGRRDLTDPHQGPAPLPSSRVPVWTTEGGEGGEGGEGCVRPPRSLQICDRNRRLPPPTSTPSPTTTTATTTTTTITTDVPGSTSSPWGPSGCGS